ncbi:NAD(+)/NADH kinase [Peptacetobacter hominis]|uniref:NAD kinase n=1 Tax=Peptacetobacter hominis TaxID=2743610 RepID=A0A544QTT3_9FIRM|nr:NAD(+)/NADH kinase [Peptacetobacter hominis]TQQ84092.1 NAD(+)/NADH kinase [Peptacetobacter hominis]
MKKRLITVNSNTIGKSIETEELLKRKLVNAGFEVSNELHPETELIVCIGGDGSFLRTVRDFDYPEIPVVGINTGHLGFFPEVMPDEIDAFIESYLNGNYIIQEVPTLQAMICTESSCWDFYALNEICVKGDMSRTVHLGLYVNNRKIENFSGDGMIICSQTGSTAYSYSAGGSIIDCNVEVMQLTPLSPINTNAYRSFTSSIIVPKDTEIRLVPEYRFEDSILIVIDGIEHRHKKISDIKIYTSDIKLKLLRLSDYEFWNRVSKKFL